MSWKSKKLKFICTSTSEAEYLALFVAAKEALFVAYILKEGFGIDLFPVKMYCDNRAVVEVLRQSGAAELTKYMATKLFKLQEWIERGLIEVNQIESKKNIADGFTKIGKNFIEFKKWVLQQRGSVPDNIVVEEKQSNRVDETVAEKSLLVKVLKDKECANWRTAEGNNRYMAQACFR